MTTFGYKLSHNPSHIMRGLVVFRNVINHGLLTKFIRDVRHAEKNTHKYTSLLMNHELLPDFRLCVQRLELFSALSLNDPNYSSSFFQLLHNTKSYVDKAASDPCEFVWDRTNIIHDGGGGGMSHQDLQDLQGLTALVPLTPHNKEFGTIEFHDGFVDTPLSRKKLDALCYKPIQLNPGDLVVLDGLVPHKNQSNLSSVDNPRICLYLSFLYV